MKSKHLHFKRFRMEASLQDPPTGLVSSSPLPAGFRWLSWRDSLTFTHAHVKAQCFHDETDAIIFRSLASLEGCRDLMQSIRDRPGFCSAATWLILTDDANDVPSPASLTGNCVATVQGVIDDSGHGGIQNVGVRPEYRGRGLGRALVRKAVAGFIAAGASRVYLEVTASNQAAMRLYRNLGFRCTKTVYRSVPIPEPEPVAIGL